MKLFVIVSTICLIVLIGQTSAVRYSESASESGTVKEKLKVKITQKETIHEEEPECSCEKGKVFVNHANKPLYVTGKSRRVVVPASEPIFVKPAPVIIRQKGDVEVRPIHITKQPPPVIVTKKIVKLHQPVIKKYYVEKYRKHEEGCAPHIISQKVSKKTCDCKTTDHVVNPKFDWSDEDDSPQIHSKHYQGYEGGHAALSQKLKALQSKIDDADGDLSFDEGDF